MKKKDFLIVAIVLLLAGALALVFHFTGGETPGAVQVKVDGKVIGTYSLAESRAIPLDTKYGHNELIITNDGEAYMKEADCPDRYCVEQGRISKTGETIVCLPHKLVVEAVAGEASDVDSLAK